MENRIFSTESAKAIKAGEYGFLNAILYMAPADISGYNLCPFASVSCKALCLGWFSGQASYVADLEFGSNPVRKSRINKSRRFVKDRANFLKDVIRSIDNLIRSAQRKALDLCVRLNGATDIAWESVRFTIVRNARGLVTQVILGGKGALNIFQHYPFLPFVDYTKDARRFSRALPENYHLTFSRSESNEPTALALLEKGVNVAVVFAGTKPTQWNGFEVIDGDEHDLRQLDPRGPRGFVIALSPKGVKARKDTSGFVVRQAA